jgi:hypothetical protein
VDEPEIYGTMDMFTVERHPEFIERGLEPPDVVISHAVVLGQDDLDIVATYLKLPTQTKDHVRETAHLGHGSALRGHLNNVHSSSEKVR